MSIIEVKESMTTHTYNVLYQSQLKEFNPMIPLIMVIVSIMIDHIEIL